MDSDKVRIVREQVELEPIPRYLGKVDNALLLLSMGVIIYKMGYIHSRLEAVRLREAEE